MKTSAKNLIKRAVKEMNALRDWRQYVIVGELNSLDSDSSDNWTFSVFQKDSDGKLSPHLSDPRDILNIADALGVGLFITIDKYDFVGVEDTAFKPYIRLY